MSMTEKQFESLLEKMRKYGWSSTANQLWARDSQNKERIAQLKAQNSQWRQNYEHLIEQHMPRTGHGCEEGWSRVVEALQLQAENEELRLIISNCAAACGVGVSPDCSLDFMAGLPREIELALNKVKQ